MSGSLVILRGSLCSHCDVYMHSDQSGEVDWNTLGNILTAHLMAEVCTVTVRVHHDCMLFCSCFCTGLMCFIC